MKNETMPFVITKRKKIIEIIASLFILLFVYTALSKLSNTKQFEFSLSKSPLLGNYYKLIAIVLPLTELVVATLLFIQKTRRWGLYASLLLMIIFTGYLAYMLSTAEKLPCSCGGVISKMTWQQHLVFNIVWTLLALAGVFLSTKKYEPQTKATMPEVVFT